MPLVFGLDIGTTSVGFAVIDHDLDLGTGKIRRLGVRIFPEARDPQHHVPLNQERRAARLRRRQLRRRRERRRQLRKLLCEAGLLPVPDSSDWHEAMKRDPYDLRRRASEGDSLSPHEIGRAIYHLAQRRHFKGRAIDEISDDAGPENGDADDKKAASARKEAVQALQQALKQEGKTLGAWLSGRGEHLRKRGEHATREIVKQEFDEVWLPLLPDAFRESISGAIFHQRPVFWRLNTLGECRFVPGARLCPKGSWLSQERRMLEKLNNLSLAGANQRPLDAEERKAILAKLKSQASMTWGAVRQALAPVYRERGERGAHRSLRFNLEEGGEKKLLGNAVEAKLASIFGSDWQGHPHQQQIREEVPDSIWRADYAEVGTQRVVILPEAEREAHREKAARRFITELGLPEDQAAKVKALKLPTGWEPYSTEALREILPHLEAGERFGELVNGPDWETWRDKTFPNRDRPTGEELDRLPSPARPEENKHIAGLRNPTVARARNELRKVVNNLIDMFGKPDLIRVELARDVGMSKRKREEKTKGIRRQEQRREKARKDLIENGIQRPSRSDIEKWTLWEECGRRCPYTGDSISFDALFQTGDFEVEHIWPRSRSLDDSFGNKTLCRKDVNSKKGSQTPFECFGHDQEEWAAIAHRLNDMKTPKGGVGMSPGKIRRFLANTIPDGFTARQLNDTGYAAREAVAYLKKLWPDVGPNAPVKVSAVSGRVTAYLRRLWGLNNILADDGEKTRADHRHHAIDALVVACCHPGMTQGLSQYWQDVDNPQALSPRLPPPWEAVRSSAGEAVADIVVSHRVRKKISGPLHKETAYGDTGEEETGEGGPTYRFFVTRKNVEALSKKELGEIRDERVREIVKEWVDDHGGDPKKAFPPYPKRGPQGPEIRRVRVLKKQQVELMVPASTGYADPGNNHHIAIYRLPNGKVDYEVVTLLEAASRLARHEPVVRRKRGDGARFVMSLSLGDSLRITRNGETKVRVVESVWASGQVVMVNHDDADGTTRFRPNASSIVANDGAKLSVDPIGQIRPAND